MLGTVIAMALVAMPIIVKCYDKAPVTINDMGLRKFTKPFAAAATVAGLTFGKRVINGPSFEENVSLADRVAVITGGNTGLGKETAIKLASLGAETYILCKSPDRAQAALKEICARSGSNKISSLQVDLSDLQSVSRCANQLKSRVGRIDIMINNAGVMAIPKRELTADGFEKHLGINHLGHFALTGQLMELIRTPNPAGAFKRIVTVSSAAHLLGQLRSLIRG